jgi:hypothetical protein
MNVFPKLICLGLPPNDVWNCTIRAFKPDDQTNPMPNDDAHKILWWNTVDSKRLNNRQFGTQVKREK